MSVRNATVAPGESGPGAELLPSMPLPLPAFLEQFLQLVPDANPGQQFPCQFAALSLDVVPDGAGDDAAVGCTDDPHLLRDRRHRAGKGRTGGASAGSRRWISLGLARRFVRFCGAFAGGAGARRNACARTPARHDRSCGASRCRALSVQRAEGGLPQEMPQPFHDPVFPLEHASMPHLPARLRSGRVVPRLLLGADAGDVCSRG